MSYLDGPLSEITLAEIQAEAIRIKALATHDPFDPEIRSELKAVELYLKAENIDRMIRLDAAADIRRALIVLAAEAAAWAESLTVRPPTMAEETQNG